MQIRFDLEGLKILLTTILARDQLQQMSLNPFLLILVTFHKKYNANPFRGLFNQWLKGGHRKYNLFRKEEHLCNKTEQNIPEPVLLGDYLFILPSVKFWKNAANLLFEYNIEYGGKGN